MMTPKKCITDEARFSFCYYRRLKVMVEFIEFVVEVTVWWWKKLFDTPVSRGFGCILSLLLEKKPIQETQKL